MVFLCWNRPSPQQQKECLNKSSGFNYDPKYKGSTSESVSVLQDLSKDGYVLNHARVALGSGVESFEKAKLALRNWRHFGLDWAFVDPKIPIREGTKFCVCTKQLLPWVIMPLEVVYVEDSSNPKKGTASFRFGSGTLQGHLLAGEERFSVEIDEKNQVWYEILSFSKPAHFLSLVGYPYVKLQQKVFAHQSANDFLKHVRAQ